MRELYPFQTVGAVFLAARKEAFLSDEPGLGKTVQAREAADNVSARSVLVICPEVAITHWAQEFVSHQALTRAVIPCRAGFKRAAVRALLARLWPNVALVTNYDLLSQKAGIARDMLRAWDWDLVILDEAHMLKNPSANRTKAIYGTGLNRKNCVVQGAARVWCLSGTPAPNHAGELYTHLRALFPQTLYRSDVHRLMTQIEFEERYCKVENRWHGGVAHRIITGSKNRDNLARMVRSVMLRRRTENVLPQLPDFRFVPEPLEWPTAPAIRQELVRVYERVSQAVARRGVDMDDPEAVVQVLSGQSEALATVRRATGMIKAPLIADLVRAHLDGNWRKLIVFAIHHDVIDLLSRMLAGFSPAVLDGRTSTAARTKAIDRFQNDPHCRVFLGQIKACGVAITLTAAKHVLFAEVSTVPSENYQAAKRAHRIGQRDAVLAQLLYLPGTIDKPIIGLLARKAAELQEIFE